MKAASLIHTRRKRHSSGHEYRHYDHNTKTSGNRLYEPPRHRRLSDVHQKANLVLQCCSEAWEHICLPFDALQVHGNGTTLVPGRCHISAAAVVCILERDQFHLGLCNVYTHPLYVSKYQLTKSYNKMIFTYLERILSLLLMHINKATA